MAIWFRESTWQYACFYANCFFLNTFHFIIVLYIVQIAISYYLSIAINAINIVFRKYHPMPKEDNRVLTFYNNPCKLQFSSYSCTNNHRIFLQDTSHINRLVFTAIATAIWHAASGLFFSGGGGGGVDNHSIFSFLFEDCSLI